MIWNRDAILIGHLIRGALSHTRVLLSSPAVTFARVGSLALRTAVPLPAGDRSSCRVI